MKNTFKHAVLLLSFCLSAFSVVSPNPFLRPNSGEKPILPKFTAQKKQPMLVDASKEIEFRGYFILKGQPFFCIFNKKSGHGEWVTLTESTYESFLVEEFDMQTETLTVVYEDRPYNLSLQDAVSSSNANPPGKSLVLSPNNKTNFQSDGQKFMPPKPKTTPSLPTWLVNQRSNRTNTLIDNQRIGGGTNNSSYPGSVPRRIVQSPFFPSSGNPLGGSDSISQPLFNSIPSSTNQATSQPSENSLVGTQVPNPIQMDGDLIINESQTNHSEIDLENLPPPPPPPNILPPSPPPDILPSRDE